VNWWGTRQLGHSQERTTALYTQVMITKGFRGESHLASWKMTPSVYRDPDVTRLTPWRMALR